jgi:hypothetical protein
MSEGRPQSKIINWRTNFSTVLKVDEARMKAQSSNVLTGRGKTDGVTNLAFPSMMRFTIVSENREVPVSLDTAARNTSIEDTDLREEIKL